MAETCCDGIMGTGDASGDCPAIAPCCRPASTPVPHLTWDGRPFQNEESAILVSPAATRPSAGLGGILPDWGAHTVSIHETDQTFLRPRHGGPPSCPHSG
ncbi:hypothetical protein [Palleronia marisminoris]|uniref:hypothetical protein n=1 Tax=Palleronia marisminoris TaxID=315423 RepID=UPI0011140BE0|nr:hypothetical protein [Palleronia marisminoris]